MEIVKDCPECGESMLVRENAETNEEVIGCSQYPKCRYTEELPIYLKLRAMGSPTLPGFSDEELES